ncbi:MAG: polysaccharide biosynthesis protein [Crocinitomicaceae bacterium]|nr:polysaccharide biosynthesis protein [Crocinitomicaceae bacterium]MDP4760402.1 polysaccharide biosynthesis protein [Crocinitomicaceae bacterium]
MLKLKQNTPRWVVILLDLMIHLCALAFAYLIRFDLKADFSLIQNEWTILSKSLWFFILVKIIVFYIFQIHKGLVRYTSTEDLKRILFAELGCSLLFLLAGLIRVHQLDGFFLFPMSVLIMEFIASMTFIVGGRFIIKLLYLESIKDRNTQESVIIYGAGVSGLITKRTLEKDTLNQQIGVAFIDDNPKLQGSRIEGITVYNSKQLSKIKSEFNAQTLIVAIQSPDNIKMQAVVDEAMKLKMTIQKVPNPKTWINGAFSSKQLKKIRIEDLLGRDIIELNNDQLSNEISNSCILVSGAAGSIGSGLVQEIARLVPKKIILLDQAESPLYDLQFELNQHFNGLNYEIVVGDICNLERMQHLFQQYAPDIVFHAAAYKHVPMMELNAAEAVQTNVKGTKILADLSLETGVKKFIMISTDKAVNPTNVMGASKRIAEMYVQKLNEQQKTQYITTRFGNVLGSNGSVIPLFQKQIENGGPVTVTDERITRFFMTIPEACQLVLEAASMGKGGEIFVFEMGQSVKIVDLARRMIQLSGLEIGKDIDLTFTGLRPGEKLYEELLANEENTVPTHHQKILIAKTRVENDEQLQHIQTLIQLCADQNNVAIVQQMKRIVPEFISNNSEFQKLDK